MGRGRGRGRGRGGRGGGDDMGGDHNTMRGSSDQYGDSMRSQDRDTSGHAGAHKSGGGGGSAGGGGAKGPKLTFQKQMPKLLQQYQHLLGSKGRGGGGGEEDEDEPTIDDDHEASMARKRPRCDEEDEPVRRDGGEDVEADALRRAMQENPALAAEFEATLSKRIGESEAEVEKEKGNSLFKRGLFSEALFSFTRCIEKSSSNEVFYSNRSACHASLGAWPDALADARVAVKLKPSWAKAHVRLGQAFVGLNLFSEAKGAFESAAKIEPDNATIRSSLQHAMMGEMREVQANKHTYKTKATRVDTEPVASIAQASAFRLQLPEEGSIAGGVQKNLQHKKLTGGPKVTTAKKTLLSFDAEEDE